VPLKEHGQAKSPVLVNGDVDGRIQPHSEVLGLLGVVVAIVHAQNIEIVLVDSLRKLGDENQHLITLLAFGFEYVKIFLDEFIEGEIAGPQTINFSLQIRKFNFFLGVGKGVG
jgi:hypothetical protein